MKMSSSNVRYPSARTKSMADFMEFTHQPGWRPEVVDKALLKQIGIAPSKLTVTLHSIYFLGLTNDSGETTGSFDELKQDYQNTLKRIVQDKYAGLFKVIPAKLANQKRLVTFFTSNGTAIDTAEYQANLFVWLCRQAGIELPNLRGGFPRARFGNNGGDKSK